MRKLRNLIGMPVVMDGKRIGRLVQAELSDDLCELSGVWIDAGLFGTRRIPSENLEMIGQLAVTADSRGERKRCKAAFPSFRAVSTDGRRLGAISGAEIDELTFRVQALELSGGFWDDIYSGRSRIYRYRFDPESKTVIVLDSTEANEKEDKA